jgi:hypothetical protein
MNMERSDFVQQNPWQGERPALDEPTTEAQTLIQLTSNIVMQCEAYNYAVSLICLSLPTFRTYTAPRRT